MRPSARIFHCLSLCARPVADAASSRELAAALAPLSSWHELLDAAEHHGLEALLLSHLRASDIEVPADAHDRLKARCVQHAQAFSVRTRVALEVLSALEGAGVPLLVLKGAALAQLVYANPRLRPMRDVDVLVPEPEAMTAWHLLRRFGFSPSGRGVGPAHHHLQGMSRTVDGATITIELHTNLFARTPFVAPLRYQDLCRASQPFDWGGLTLRTLGHEDMLWHVYAHAFVINVFCRGIRLISVADVIHATEAWVDALDWHDLDRRYRRMVHALALVDHLTPWSSRVPDRLRPGTNKTRSAVQPLAVPSNGGVRCITTCSGRPNGGSACGTSIRGPLDRMWYRCIGHPARLAAAAAAAVTRRLLDGSQPGDDAVPTGERL